MVQNVHLYRILDVSITTKLYTMKLIKEFNTAQKVAFLIIAIIGILLINHALINHF